MYRALYCLLLFLALAGALAAQQPSQTPAWDVSLKSNSVADSNLEVVNRCKKNHQFLIQLQNLPFLNFSSTQVNVKGGAKQLVPVKFDTRNLAPGVYQGSVLVICQTCKSEGTCTQDREVLQVVLRVTSDSATAGPPPAPTTNLPANTPTTNQPATKPSPPAVADQTTGRVASGIMLSPIPEALAEALASALKKKERVEQELAELRAAAAAAQEAAEKARHAADTAEQDARKAQAEVDAAKKAKDDAVKAVNEANKAVAAAEAALAKAISEGTTPDRAAARAALEKAQADLAAAQKALKDAQAAIATGKMQAAAAEAAKKAKQKKAEADKAAAALAAAQAALAEKEKEYLKAQQEVAAAQAAKDKAEQEARARAEAKAAADKAAQEKLWADDIRRRQEEQQERARNAVEIEYLISNIKELGLIPDRPKRNVPDPTDYIFNKLRQLAGQTVGDFLQTVAGEIGGAPFPPTGVIGVLGEMYNGIGSFFNLSTGVGYDNILKTLQGMNNPNVKPPNLPRNYTEKEAADKIRKMQLLMEKLKKKLAEAQAAAGK